VIRLLRKCESLDVSQPLGSLACYSVSLASKADLTAICDPIA
jgi:hypothetical protein